MMPTRRTTWLLPVALLLLAAPVRGQESDARWLERCEDSRSGEEVFCEIRALSVRTTGSIEVASSNGVIDLRGADQADVRLRARVRAWGDDAAEARELARGVVVSTDGGRIRADGPRSGRGSGWSVDFVGTLPRAYDVTVETQNGPLALRDVSGRIDVESQNGPVDLTRVGGVVRARSSNGPLTVEMTDTRVPADGVDLASSNGPLTVLMPRSISGRLEASSQNGPISTDLDVDIRRPSRYSVSGEIDATLGQGGGILRVRTQNGPLTLRASD